MEFLTQHIGSTPRGLSIRGSQGLTHKVEFLPDIQEDAPNTLKLETVVLVEGSWQYVACKNDELKFYGSLNLEVATLDGFFSLAGDDASFKLGSD